MPVITLTDSTTGSTARILPDVGFNCFEFQVHTQDRVVDVLDSKPEFSLGKGKPSASGIPILFPFPNRIRKGQYTWLGQSYSLPGTDKWGNAIHGFCLDRPWRIINQRSDFVTGEFQLSVDAPDRRHLWPTDFVIEVDYELVNNRLRANFRIANPTEKDLPWGLGTHPYFKLPLSEASRPAACLIDAPVHRQWELADCLPTGRVVPVPPEKALDQGAYFNVLQLDDVYTGLDYDGPQFELSVIDEDAGLQVTQTCPPIFREVVVFTPPGRNAVCLEPYSCTTDAINLSQQGLDAGLRTLGPGSEFHTWIDISAGPIMA